MLATTKHRKKSPHAENKIAIEISRGGLTFVRCAPGEPPHAVRWRQVEFEHPISSLHGEQARETLRETFSRLVAEESLAGCRVSLALSSDFCVTRVVSGENEFVAQELRGLVDRSAMYLSLGTGTKVHAESVRTIDAKRQTARMSIANELTLMAVCEAASGAGLAVADVEHSMIGLCRVVGHTGIDQESPVLIVEIGQRGVELGISHRGQLLLDYRPGGMDVKDRIAETILRHRKRLQRYCNRVFHFPDGKISQVVVCGDPAETPQICEVFQNQGCLTAIALDAESLQQSWLIDEADLVPAQVLSCLGIALGQQMTVVERASPNLAGFYLNAHRGPLIPELARNAWPIPVVMVLVLLMWIGNMFSGWKNEALREEVESREAELAKVRMMQLKVLEADAKLEQAQFVKGKMFNPSVRQLIESIAGCMPEGVWLVELRIDKDGAIQLSGKSRGDQAIFELVNFLKKSPHLADVTLEGTRPDRHQTESVTYFELKCKYGNFNGGAQESGNHG